MPFGISVPGITRARSCSRSTDGPYDRERTRLAREKTLRSSPRGNIRDDFPRLLACTGMRDSRVVASVYPTRSRTELRARDSAQHLGAYASTVGAQTTARLRRRYARGSGARDSPRSCGRRPQTARRGEIRGSRFHDTALVCREMRTGRHLASRPRASPLRESGGSRARAHWRNVDGAPRPALSDRRVRAAASARDR